MNLSERVKDKLFSTSQSDDLFEYDVTVKSTDGTPLRGFDIEVDGKPVSTPVMVEAGDHDVAITSAQGVARKRVTIDRDLHDVVIVEPARHYQYDVTVQTPSGDQAHNTTIFVDGDICKHFPIEMGEGEHTIRVESEKYEQVEKTVTVDRDILDTITVQPTVSDGIIVNPRKDEIAAKLTERLADTLQTSHLRPNMVSDDTVELYHSIADVVEIEVVESENEAIAHEYSYIVHVVSSTESRADEEYGHDTSEDTDVYIEEFDSPVEAVEELRDNLPAPGNPFHP